MTQEEEFNFNGGEKWSKRRDQNEEPQRGGTAHPRENGGWV